VVGGVTLWSDYSPLLANLPASNGEYAGPVPDAAVPGELEACDVLLQPSHYEPFALTVGEALAAGVPVVTTTEVGASEGVNPEVMTTVRPGDIAGLREGIEATLERLDSDQAGVAATARAEAERLFAPSVVCDDIERALLELVAQ
jgi:glycosyltransferase involved in cell wall biosynthesis